MAVGLGSEDRYSILGLEHYLGLDRKGTLSRVRMWVAAKNLNTSYCASASLMRGFPSV